VRVQREDYDEAERLKEAIGRVKQLGAKIAQLEAYKAVRASAHSASCITSYEYNMSGAQLEARKVASLVSISSSAIKTKQLEAYMAALGFSGGEVCLKCDRARP
jgi:hypothetical protein